MEAYYLTIFWNCRGEIRIKKEKDVDLGSKADYEESVRFQRYSRLCFEPRYFYCEVGRFASVLVVEHVPSVNINVYRTYKRLALVDLGFSIYYWFSLAIEYESFDARVVLKFVHVVDANIVGEGC
jgi:hypothetical protein